LSGRKRKSESEVVTEKKSYHKAVVLPDGTMADAGYPEQPSGEEHIKISTESKVEKFRSRKDFEENKPYEVIIVKDNVMLNEGANLLWTLVCGGGGTPYSNANARVGVGDSNSAEDPAQTGLQGGNQLYKNMDATYPTYGSARQAVFRGTFVEAEANWHWQEWTVDNGAVAGININRKVQDLGTKPNTEIWRLTVTLSF